MHRMDSITTLQLDRLVATAVVAADLAVWMFLIPFHTALSLH